MPQRNTNISWNQIREFPGQAILSGIVMRKTIIGLLFTILLLCGSVYGYQSASNGETDPSQPYLMFDLVYNFDVYQRPVFFMPKSHPTFVIWLEESETGYRESIFVTKKAGKNAWNFADSRPEAIPVWSGVNKIEKRQHAFDIDAVSGATPKDDTARIYWQIPDSLQGKTVDIYIEANNSFDFNDHYNNKKGKPGYSGANGQPSIVWKASITFSHKSPQNVSPEIIGHGHLFGENHRLFEDISKITTAANTFQEIRISYFRP